MRKACDINVILDNVHFCILKDNMTAMVKYVKEVKVVETMQRATQH